MLSRLIASSDKALDAALDKLMRGAQSRYSSAENRYTVRHGSTALCRIVAQHQTPGAGFRHLLPGACVFSWLLLYYKTRHAM
jgi:hypothetical protein